MVWVALSHLSGLVVGLALVWPVWIWLSFIAAALIVALWDLKRSGRIHGPAPGKGYALLGAILTIGCLQGSHLALSDRRAVESLPAWVHNEMVEATGDGIRPRP